MHSTDPTPCQNTVQKRLANNLGRKKIKDILLKVVKDGYVHE